MEWLLLGVPVAGLIALFGPGRYPQPPMVFAEPSPRDLEDWSPPDEESGVREPRRPLPQAGGAAAAVDPYDEASG